MKKLIISITAAFCILLGILLFGKFISLSNNQNISQKIQENLSLDNKNIKEVNTASLRNSQTLVSQETYLFNVRICELA